MRSSLSCSPIIVLRLLFRIFNVRKQVLCSYNKLVTELAITGQCQVRFIIVKIINRTYF
ncbi:hypothetical protein TTHERM_000530688 (macronuclear) [Tetrahymena thermophila SB210]|uniref:Uncharacterized protein n=1 Tax=Tetrahymena thermophila (strain SB210) TaxID=312017 RepID=W7X7R7_TETTS|nr:hypothetical protein TTHERM_000530688 [Tetrahymena thermophila SB210]EWS72468.1 hypothetical protein TTHERM_000530688 [Tetrahymena thermophila SB210]|eukprot:XP_012655013.1 hypothetical protein TTHERM_000530688 [Tetrahymena thermophila SB210]